MRWDVHNHAVPRAALAALGADSPVQIDGDMLAADRVRFRLTPEFTDPTAKLAQLAALGVDATVISVAPPLFCYDVEPRAGEALCRAVNQGLAELCEHDPARMRWMAHVPLQDPSRAAAMLDEAVAAGAVGVQIATSVVGRPLDGPELEPFWEAADRSGKPVMLHPAYNAPHPNLEPFYLQNVIGNQLETTIAAERLVCSGLLERHRNVLLFLVHAGGFVPWQLGRLRHARGVRPELTEAPGDPMDALQRIVVDTITHDPTVLRLLVERMGPDRVMLGSDLPFDMASEDTVADLEQAVGHERARQITTDTPARLFGL
jgi:aminocarboxymuconate-semialdehyde decarboxylase